MKTRQKIRFAAIGALLAYSVFRFLLVNATLAAYGVNPWIFLIIDALSGVTYVLGIEILVVALAVKRSYQWRKTICWAIVAAASFAAPYLYLFANGQKLPSSVLLGLGLVVLLLLAGAILSIARKVRHYTAR